MELCTVFWQITHVFIWYIYIYSIYIYYSIVYRWIGLRYIFRKTLTCHWENHALTTLFPAIQNKHEVFPTVFLHNHKPSPIEFGKAQLSQAANDRPYELMSAAGTGFVMPRAGWSQWSQWNENLVGGLEDGFYLFLFCISYMRYIYIWEIYGIYMG